MSGDVDVEEPDGSAVGADQRRALPDGPTVVVPAARDHGRVVPRPAIRPGLGDGAGKIGVIGLKDDLPGVAAVANDHRLGTTLTHRS